MSVEFFVILDADKQPVWQAGKAGDSVLQPEVFCRPLTLSAFAEECDDELTVQPGIAK